MREEIFAGGKHIATYTNNTTYFAHADWLGTERVRSDMSGAPCETISSLPFGDAQSTSGSCGDPSTRHFTDKERDPESGNDYFGARYYSSNLGRLNLYGYVENSPLNTVDADGHSEDSVTHHLGKAFSNATTALEHAGTKLVHSYEKVGETLERAGKNVLNAVEDTANRIGTGIGDVVGGAASGDDQQVMAGINKIGSTVVPLVVGGEAAAADEVGDVASAARTAESAGSTAVKEGIYEGADATAPGRTYVGQSGNIPERLTQHEASGKFPAGTSVATTEVKGGKTAREIAEQKRINERGGVRSKPGSTTSNVRNPIGEKRSHLLVNKDK